MAVLGLRGTGDWGTDERPKNFRESILWMDPNGSAPLTALLSKCREESTDDPEFAWWSEKLQSIRVKTTAQVTNTTTANTLALTATISSANGNTGAGKDLVAGDILMREPSATVTFTSTEYLVVASDPTADTQITVTRAALGSTVSTIATGDILIKVGNAYEEGSTSPTATTRNPTKDYNYTQIFKTAYNLTRTAQQTRARTGDPLKNDKKRRMFDHSVAMEQAFLFGLRNETTGSAGKPLRYTRGLITQLVTDSRVTKFSATATEASFLTAIQDCFDFSASFSGDERLVLGGNTFMMALNQLVKSSGQIQFQEQVKLYGMNLARYITPVGNLYFRRHPLFNQSTALSQCAIILDVGAVKYRYLQDTVAQDNIQANDADQKKGQWLTEAGLELTESSTSKFLQNMYYP